MKKRIASLLLALTLAFALLPMVALAAEVEHQVGPAASDTITFDTSTGTIIAANPSIVTANIPASIDGVAVSAIGENVFWGTTVTNVTLPESLTSIGRQAFYTCYYLAEIDIPDNVRYIGYMAFAQCDALETFTFPEGLTTIEDSTFDTDSMFGSLTTVYIPVSVTKIGFDVFGKLADVYYAGTKEQWEAIDIRGDHEATSVQYNPNRDLRETATIHFGIESAPANHSFIDVVADSYYEDAVVWALENNVTSGTSNTTFSPADTCTRGQVVTFLWRAAGCPEPTGSNNPFTDVKASDYFYKAVLWAVEQEITTGISTTAFSPNTTCNNAQVLTFIWRANGSPDKIEMSGLKYYSSAVNWATRNGILIPNSLLEPEDNCPRSDVVYYLHGNANR